MRCGEFLVVKAGDSPSITAGDVAVDSRSAPTMIRVFLRRAKCDPFGKGIHIYMGRAQSALCPVAAILNYLASRPEQAGPLMIWKTGSPLTREAFVRLIRQVLTNIGLNASEYAGHSFRIGAATTAALAGIPDHMIKTLGRWESEAYTLYVRTDREALARISQTLVA